MPMMETTAVIAIVALVYSVAFYAFGSEGLASVDTSGLAAALTNFAAIALATAILGLFHMAFVWTLNVATRRMENERRTHHEKVVPR
jgi:hypothetical protein